MTYKCLILVSLSLVLQCWLLPKCPPMWLAYSLHSPSCCLWTWQDVHWCLVILTGPSFQVNNG